MIFDALKSVEELQDAGIPEAHAKAQIRILQGVIESDLATKRDLEELRKATAHDLNELRQLISIVGTLHLLFHGWVPLSGYGCGSLAACTH